LASSINVINCYDAEIKEIDKAIIRQVAGFNQNHYDVLLSIPGVGKVFAAGILAEIADINQFESDDALAKYAGITWRKTQSGKFEAEDTQMTKTGNKYLRYFIIQAANMARQFIPEYRDYYQKKFDEVTTHQHKRALALTARKLIRLIYGLLSTNRLYQ
ncbi:transposase, partial [Paracholeplasma manati]|uniref:transposase n=1 Tax=Paracholeplasma manati TaxID=591373 RepID=UPI002408234C